MPSIPFDGNQIAPTLTESEGYILPLEKQEICF